MSEEKTRKENKSQPDLILNQVWLLLTSQINEIELLGGKKYCIFSKNCSHPWKSRLFYFGSRTGLLPRQMFLYLQGLNSEK